MVQNLIHGGPNVGEDDGPGAGLAAPVLEAMEVVAKHLGQGDKWADMCPKK